MFLYRKQTFHGVLKQTLSMIQKFHKGKVTPLVLVTSTLLDYILHVPLTEHVFAQTSMMNEDFRMAIIKRDKEKVSTLLASGLTILCTCNYLSPTCTTSLYIKQGASLYITCTVQYTIILLYVFIGYNYL